MILPEALAADCTNLRLDKDLLEASLSGFVEDVDGLIEGGVIVPIDQDPSLWVRNVIGLQPVEELVEVNEFFIPCETALLGNGDRGRSGGFTLDSTVCLREDYGHTLGCVQRKREQHERGEEEENDIDERDDLNARLFLAAAITA